MPARTHFIRDKVQDTYFRRHYVLGESPRPVGPSSCIATNKPDAKTRLEADLYEQHDACAIATAYYGPDGFTQGKWEIIEATVQEHARWKARRGGETNSAAKNRARARNGTLYGGRKRVCKACGGPIERDQPKTVNVCKSCQSHQ